MTGYIKSIQKFSISLTGTNTSATATISAVNAAKAVIFFDGFTPASTNVNFQFWMSRVELTNSTTVTAFRDSADSTTSIVTGTVIEFTSAALEGSGVQYGTITIPTSSTSNTGTISSVTTANSALFFLGFTVNSAGAVVTQLLPRLTLTNATTVTAQVDTAPTTNTITIGYAVVDFASAVLQSIQPRSVTLTGSNTSDTDTITAVNPDNALVLHNGSTTHVTGFNNSFYSLFLVATDTVKLQRAGSNVITRTINYTVLEFASGVLNSAVQRGTISLASITSDTDTISSVNPSTSVCNFVGFLTTATTGREAESSVALTNATTVTANKNTAGSSTSTVSYEIAEFIIAIGSSVAVTESADSMVASAHVIHAVSGSANETADSLSASAHVIVHASVAATESPDTTVSDLAAFFRVTGSRDISYSTHAASSGAAIAPVLFAKLEFDEGDINLHTWLGDISFSGDTYTGVGKFAGIGAADEVSDLSMTNITLSLSGLPNDLISVLFNQQYQGRRATIFLGYLDQTTFLLVDTPTILYRGIIDTADFAQSDTFSISLSVGNRFAAWNNPIVRRYNNADQQNRFPGDKGLQFIEQSTQKTVIWGAAS